MSTQKNNRISKRAIPGHTLTPKDDHYQIKKIGGVSGKQFNTDPRFNLSRRNNQEFGHLMKLSALIRSNLLVEAGASLPARPFTNVLRELQQADEQHCFGNRSPLNGPIQQLEGFNFNEACPWQSCVNIHIPITVDTLDNEIEITFPACTANQAVNPPPGATHYTLYAIVAWFDLHHWEGDKMRVKASLLPLKAIQKRPETRRITIGYNQLNIIVTGVRWYQMKAGTNKISPLKIPGPVIISKIWKSGDHKMADKK
ncbi:hypothetical protein HB364_29015 [Pseudoflavitalea sp. X16]|uniref:hypothetical protein n=1 Tax=Paraflavitalea devenefica TaxID=2716334 RepID=UPI001423D86C|nr:hypothetical protein [Paraflavitalea devenefica]NII29155.1 hypothetical protein [Paraflavitalea devenefica]